jgi:heme-degrading monooxygenase HmoA
VFVRVWQYDVPGQNAERFVDAYGSSGDWARLFSRGRGYLNTALYRAAETPDRFITVDRWSDQEAWLAFLDEWRQAYDALDAALEGLASTEEQLIAGTS